MDEVNGKRHSSRLVRTDQLSGMLCLVFCCVDNHLLVQDLYSMSFFFDKLLE